MNQKYEISGVPHPKYPWLHRIRARRDIDDIVEMGDLGGFVEHEENLSQDGDCWIFDDAICCEDAAVKGNALLYDGVLIRENARIVGNAVFYDRATAEGSCFVSGGEVQGEARIAGFAMVKESEETKLSPRIAGKSQVYGTVSGNYQISGLVRPEENLINRTRDLFIYDNGKWSVLVPERDLRFPEKYQKKMQKKENRER